MNYSTSGVRLLALHFVLCLVLIQKTGSCTGDVNLHNKLKSCFESVSWSGHEEIHPELASAQEPLLEPKDRQINEKEFKQTVVDPSIPTKKVLPVREKLRSFFKFGRSSLHKEIPPEPAPEPQVRQINEEEFKKIVVDYFFPTKDVLLSPGSRDEGVQENEEALVYYDLLKDTPEWQDRIKKTVGQSPELKNDEHWPPKHVHPSRSVPIWDPSRNQIIFVPSRSVPEGHDIAPDTLDTLWREIIEFLTPERHIEETYRIGKDGNMVIITERSRAAGHYAFYAETTVDSKDHWKRIKFELKRDLRILRRPRYHF